MKSSLKQKKRSPLRYNIASKGTYKSKRVSEQFSKSDMNSQDYRTSDAFAPKEAVSVSFDDETEKSIPMSSEKAQGKQSGKTPGNQTPHFEEAIHALSINQPKLKRIFNYHVKTTHNKIEFAEFLKFCKSTQIFPNFISIIHLKKIIGQIVAESKVKGKKATSLNLQEKSVSNNTMITFKEFHKSIKKMALFTLENSSEISKGDKIQGFIKHINVNCQYNYNVQDLVSESPETPVKGRSHHSFSSSLCEETKGNETSKISTEGLERAGTVEERASNDLQDDHMIDDNINRALKALKSPRLSIPTSNEKASNRDSSRSRFNEDHDKSAPLDSVGRQSSGLKISSLKSYPNNPYERHRSASRGRRSRSISQNSNMGKNPTNEREELKEFLEIEKSCQESDPPTSTLSSLVSPHKDFTSSKIQSNKHLPEKSKAKDIPHFQLERPESRNQDEKQNFKVKTEPSQTSFKTKGKKGKKRSTERVTFQDPIIVSDFGKTPKPDQAEPDFTSKVEKEDEDYDKKLEEIQAKYMRALNLESNSEPQLKKKEQKKKDVGFTMDEFQKLKKQVGKDKSPRATATRSTKVIKESVLTKERSPKLQKSPKAHKTIKSAKKGSKTDRAMKTRIDRSTSLKRTKTQLKPREKRNDRKNYFSRPKTFVESGLETNLDSIKNNILKIKEKALSGEEETPKQIPPEKRPNPYSLNATVNISEINLGNVKEKKVQSQENSVILSKQKKEIPTFSLHKTDKSAEITESELSNLTSKEPESHHPIRGPKGSGTPSGEAENEGKSTLYSNLTEFDHGVNFSDFQPKMSSKSLNEAKKNKTTKMTKHQSVSKPAEKKERTVRFEEDKAHHRQTSGIEFYHDKKSLFENEDSAEQQRFTEGNTLEKLDSSEVSKLGQFSQTQGPNYLKKRMGDLGDSEPPSSESTPKTPFESASEVSTGQYPSITNLRTNFGKHKSPKFNYNNDASIDGFTINDSRPNKSHKLCFMLLDKIVKEKQKESMNEGFKKIKDMNNLCREYRAQMLLSLTKLFAVVKHNQTKKKAHAFAQIQTKNKLEALAESLASDASNSLKGMFLSKVKNMM